MSDELTFQVICGGPTVKAPSNLPETSKYVMDGN